MVRLLQLYSTKVAGAGMKKNKRFLAMGLVAISLLLSGCGTPLYELTADEEALIIKYAAHFIAKHNIYQKDGISVEVAEDETQEDTTQTPENPDDPVQGEVDKTPTVAEAMNLPAGITLTYTGNDVADHIKVGSAYSEEAGVGFTFYMLKFQMKNTTDKAIKVDNYGKDIVFKLTSDSVVIKSKSYPLLSNELSSYIGTVEPGDSVDVVLLFKVKTADADKISSPTLELIEKDSTKPIKL